MCMAYLHIPLTDFWQYTPAETGYALKAYNDLLKYQENMSWEQKRLGIYYDYLFAPSTKNKVSYDIFKVDYLPLAFDKINPIVAIDDSTFLEIQDILKKFGGTK